MKAMLNWLFDGVDEPTPPARVLARIRAQQERSEILVSMAQLLLVVFFAALYHVAPMAHGSLQAIDIIRGVDLIDGILAIYATLTLVRLGLALGHLLRPWMLFASVVLDIALLMTVIWSFHLKYGQPPGFYLKAPTFAYVFILIALRALRFEVRFVLFAGAMAVVGWLVLVAFASGVTETWGYNVGRPPGCEAHPCRTRDYVEYIRTDFILYGAEVDRVVTITVVTLVLALAIARARRLLIRAAAEQVAARDLSRFLAPEVAERIRRSEMAIAPGEGELRDAAILTTDLRGFTRLSLSMEPDAVMRLLQEYQSRVCPAISRPAAASTSSWATASCRPSVRRGRARPMRPTRCAPPTRCSRRSPPGTPNALPPARRRCAWVSPSPRAGSFSVRWATATGWNTRSSATR